MAQDTGGFFSSNNPIGRIVSQLMGGGQKDPNAGFMGTSIPTLPQFVSGLFGGGGESRAQDFANSSGVQQLQNDTSDRLNAQIWGTPLMSSAQDPEEDSNDHPSQIRPAGGTVTYFGGQSNAPKPVYSGQQGAATSLGANGLTVGNVSMGQVENALSSERRRGENNLTPRLESEEDRAKAKAAGMTLQQYRNQS